MQRVPWRDSVLAVVMMLSVSAVLAETQTGSLRALIPWDGEGRVFQVSPNALLFLGAFEGIIYIEKNEGELNEGFVRCPLTQKIEISSKKTSASGNCMITVNDGATVYAEWSCAGKIGVCEGDFKVTGGTGRLEGVTGSSKLMVRSPMHVLAEDMASGSVIRVASGIAILPELSYTIPAD